MLSAIDGVRVAFLCNKSWNRLEEKAFDELEIAPRRIRDFIRLDSLFCHVEQRLCAMMKYEGALYCVWSCMLMCLELHAYVVGVAC